MPRYDNVLGVLNQTLRVQTSIILRVWTCKRKQNKPREKKIMWKKETKQNSQSCGDDLYFSHRIVLYLECLDPQWLFFAFAFVFNVILLSAAVAGSDASSFFCSEFVR